jgi:hypothetical protein
MPPNRDIRAAGPQYYAPPNRDVYAAESEF